MLRRIFHAELSPGILRLDADNSHYATHVLRLRSGDVVELFDGAGGAAQGRILSTGSSVDVSCDPPAARAADHRHVELVLSPIKGPRADWAVEKLTEIGVAAIRWIQFKRSVVSPSDDRLERWQRISLAAARQCGRYHLPVIHTPVELDIFLGEESARESPQTRLVAQPGAAPVCQTAAPHAPVTLIVGPEGGLTSEELEKLQTAGYTPVALGRWTLRAETAAVVGAGMLLGDG